MDIRLFRTNRTPKQIEIRKEASSDCDSKKIPAHVRGGTRKDGGFEELGLQKWALNVLREVKIKQPSDVQRACIPAILSERDVIANSRTGSGKTAAFLLPILQKLSADPFSVFALILSPTRELTYQIYEQVLTFGHPVGVKCCMIAGGVEYTKQIGEIQQRSPHILVCTPGRLCDLLKSHRDTLFSLLSNIKYLVFDEADRLLKESLSNQLKYIVDAIKDSATMLGVTPNYRTLMFSATFSQELVNIIAIKDLCSLTDTSCGLNLELFRALDIRHPFVYSAPDFDVPSEILQKYILMSPYVKEAYLVYLLQTQFADLKGIVVFVMRCRTAEILNTICGEFGLSSSALHSRMPQKKRWESLDEFRDLKTNILIATDLCSRGLSVRECSLVVNYDMPSDPSDYLHRIGRASRDRRRSIALSFVTQFDVDFVHTVEKHLGKELTELSGVDEKKVLGLMGTVLTARSKAEVRLLDNAAFLGE